MGRPRVARENSREGYYPIVGVLDVTIIRNEVYYCIEWLGYKASWEKAEGVQALRLVKLFWHQCILGGYRTRVKILVVSMYMVKNGCLVYDNFNNPNENNDNECRPFVNSLDDVCVVGEYDPALVTTIADVGLSEDGDLIYNVPVFRTTLCIVGNSMWISFCDEINTHVQFYFWKGVLQSGTLRQLQLLPMLKDKNLIDSLRKFAARHGINFPYFEDDVGEDRPEKLLDFWDEDQVNLFDEAITNNQAELLSHVVDKFCINTASGYLTTALYKEIVSSFRLYKTVYPDGKTRIHMIDFKDLKTFRYYNRVFYKGYEQYDVYFSNDADSIRELNLAEERLRKANAKDTEVRPSVSPPRRRKVNPNSTLAMSTPSTSSNSPDSHGYFEIDTDESSDESEIDHRTFLRSTLLESCSRKAAWPHCHNYNPNPEMEHTCNLEHASSVNPKTTDEPCHNLYCRRRRTKEECAKAFYELRLNEPVRIERLDSDLPVNQKYVENLGRYGLSLLRDEFHQNLSQTRHFCDKSLKNRLKDDMFLNHPDDFPAKLREVMKELSNEILNERQKEIDLQYKRQEDLLRQIEEQEARVIEQQRIEKRNSVQESIPIPGVVGNCQPISETNTDLKWNLHNRHRSPMGSPNSSLNSSVQNPTLSDSSSVHDHSVELEESMDTSSLYRAFGKIRIRLPPPPETDSVASEETVLAQVRELPASNPTMILSETLSEQHVETAQPSSHSVEPKEVINASTDLPELFKIPNLSKEINIPQDKLERSQNIPSNEENHDDLTASILPRNVTNEEAVSNVDPTIPLDASSEQSLTSSNPVNSQLIPDEYYVLAKKTKASLKSTKMKRPSTFMDNIWSRKQKLMSSPGKRPLKCYDNGRVQRKSLTENSLRIRRKRNVESDSSILQNMKDDQKYISIQTANHSYIIYTSIFHFLARNFFAKGKETVEQNCVRLLHPDYFTRTALSQSRKRRVLVRTSRYEYLEICINRFVDSDKLVSKANLKSLKHSALSNIKSFDGDEGRQIVHSYELGDSTEEDELLYEVLQKKFPKNVIFVGQKSLTVSYSASSQFMRLFCECLLGICNLSHFSILTQMVCIKNEAEPSASSVSESYTDITYINSNNCNNLQEIMSIVQLYAENYNEITNNEIRNDLVPANSKQLPSHHDQSDGSTLMSNSKHQPLLTSEQIITPIISNSETFAPTSPLLRISSPVLLDNNREELTVRVNENSVISDDISSLTAVRSPILSKGSDIFEQRISPNEVGYSSIVIPQQPLQAHNPSSYPLSYRREPSPSTLSSPFLQQFSTFSSSAPPPSIHCHPAQSSAKVIAHPIYSEAAEEHPDEVPSSTVANKLPHECSSSRKRQKFKEKPVVLCNINVETRKLDSSIRRLMWFSHLPKSTKMSSSSSSTTVAMSASRKTFPSSSATTNSSGNDIQTPECRFFPSDKVAPSSSAKISRSSQAKLFPCFPRRVIPSSSTKVSSSTRLSFRSHKITESIFGSSNMKPSVMIRRQNRSSAKVWNNRRPTAIPSTGKTFQLRINSAINGLEERQKDSIRVELFHNKIFLDSITIPLPNQMRFTHQVRDNIRKLLSHLVPNNLIAQEDSKCRLSSFFVKSILRVFSHPPKYSTFICSYKNVRRLENKSLSSKGKSTAMAFLSSLKSAAFSKLRTNRRANEPISSLSSRQNQVTPSSIFAHPRSKSIKISSSCKASNTLARSAVPRVLQNSEAEPTKSRSISASCLAGSWTSLNEDITEKLSTASKMKKIRIRDALPKSLSPIWKTKANEETVEKGRLFSRRSKSKKSSSKLPTAIFVTTHLMRKRVRKDSKYPRNSPIMPMTKVSMMSTSSSSHHRNSNSPKMKDIRIATNCLNYSKIKSSLMIQIVSAVHTGYIPVLINWNIGEAEEFQSDVSTLLSASLPELCTKLNDQFGRNESSPVVAETSANPPSYLSIMNSLVWRRRTVRKRRKERRAKASACRYIITTAQIFNEENVAEQRNLPNSATNSNSNEKSPKTASERREMLRSQEMRKYSIMNCSSYDNLQEPSASAFCFLEEESGRCESRFIRRHHTALMNFDSGRKLQTIADFLLSSALISNTPCPEIFTIFELSRNITIQYFGDILAHEMNPHMLIISALLSHAVYLRVDHDKQPNFKIFNYILGFYNLLKSFFKVCGEYEHQITFTPTFDDRTWELVELLNITVTQLIDAKKLYTSPDNPSFSLQILVNLYGICGIVNAKNISNLMTIQHFFYSAQWYNQYVYSSSFIYVNVEPVFHLKPITIFSAGKNKSGFSLIDHIAKYSIPTQNDLPNNIIAADLQSNIINSRNINQSPILLPLTPSSYLTFKSIFAQFPDKMKDIKPSHFLRKILQCILCPYLSDEPERIILDAANVLLPTSSEHNSLMTAYNISKMSYQAILTISKFCFEDSEILSRAILQNFLCYHTNFVDVIMGDSVQLTVERLERRREIITIHKYANGYILMETNLYEVLPDGSTFIFTTISLRMDPIMPDETSFPKFCNIVSSARVDGEEFVFSFYETEFSKFLKMFNDFSTRKILNMDGTSKTMEAITQILSNTIQSHPNDIQHFMFEHFENENTLLPSSPARAIINDSLTETISSTRSENEREHRGSRLSENTEKISITITEYLREIAENMKADGNREMMKEAVPLIFSFQIDGMQTYDRNSLYMELEAFASKKNLTEEEESQIVSKFYLYLKEIIFFIFPHIKKYLAVLRYIRSIINKLGEPIIMESQINRNNNTLLYINIDINIDEAYFPFAINRYVNYMCITMPTYLLMDRIHFSNILLEQNATTKVTQMIFKDVAKEEIDYLLMYQLAHLAQEYTPEEWSAMNINNIVSGDYANNASEPSSNLWFLHNVSSKEMDRNCRRSSSSEELTVNQLFDNITQILSEVSLSSKSLSSMSLECIYSLSSLPITKISSELLLNLRCTEVFMKIIRPCESVNRILRFFYEVTKTNYANERTVDDIWKHSLRDYLAYLGKEKSLTIKSCDNHTIIFVHKVMNALIASIQKHSPETKFYMPLSSNSNQYHPSNSLLSYRFDMEIPFQLHQLICDVFDVEEPSHPSTTSVRFAMTIDIFGDYDEKEKDTIIFKGLHWCVMSHTKVLHRILKQFELEKLSSWNATSTKSFDNIRQSLCEREHLFDGADENISKNEQITSFLKTIFSESNPIYGPNIENATELDQSPYTSLYNQLSGRTEIQHFLLPYKNLVASAVKHSVEYPICSSNMPPVLLYNSIETFPPLLFNYMEQFVNIVNDIGIDMTACIDRTSTAFSYEMSEEEIRKIKYEWLNEFLILIVYNSFHSSCDAIQGMLQKSAALTKNDFKLIISGMRKDNLPYQDMFLEAIGTTYFQSFLFQDDTSLISKDMRAFAYRLKLLNNPSQVRPETLSHEQNALLNFTFHTWFHVDVLLKTLIRSSGFSVNVNLLLSMRIQLEQIVNLLYTLAGKLFIFQTSLKRYSFFPPRGMRNGRHKKSLNHLLEHIERKLNLLRLPGNPHNDALVKIRYDFFIKAFWSSFAREVEYHGARAKARGVRSEKLFSQPCYEQVLSDKVQGQDAITRTIISIAGTLVDSYQILYQALLSKAPNSQIRSFRNISSRLFPMERIPWLTFLS